MGKVCNKCKVEKDVSEFGKNKRTKDGLNYICKSCKRKLDKEWNASHKDYRNQQSKAWREAHPDKVVGYVEQRKEYLQSLKRPCVKCGEDRPKVIEFHHVDPKTKLFNISRVVCNGDKSKVLIEREIEKCVCLCANCHAEFHATYGNNPNDPVRMLEEYLTI